MPTSAISVTSAGQRAALAVAAGDEVGDRGDAVAARDADHLAQHQPGQQHRQRRPEVDRQEPQPRRRPRGRRCRNRSRRCSTRPSTARRPRRCRSPSGPARARRSAKLRHAEQQQQVGERGAEDQRGESIAVDGRQWPRRLRRRPALTRRSSASRRRSAAPSRRTARPAAAGCRHGDAAVPQRQQRKVQQQPAGREEGEQALGPRSVSPTCGLRRRSERVEPEVLAQQRRKRLMIASASFNWSRSIVLSSDGRTRLSGGCAGRALAQLVAQLQAHQEVQRLEQVAAEVGVELPALDQARAAARRCRARARGAAAPARARRARSGRCRASSGRAACSSLRGAVRRVHQRCGSSNWSAAAAKRARKASLPARMRVEVLARGLQQRGVAGHRRGVEEDRQVHRPLRVGAVDPLAQRLAKPASGCAPQRVGEHDAAGAGRVAELGQRGVEARRDRRRAAAGSKPSRSSSALSWSVLRICSPRPSLPITSRQLLATSSAGASRLHRRANRRRLSSPTRRAMRSILMPPSCSSVSHRIDALGGGLQLGHRAGIVDLQRDDVRMVGHEADQVELAEHARAPLSPSRTSSRCTRWRTISHSASNSSASGCDVDQIEAAPPRAPPVRPGGTSRSSASRRSVVVKMPSRAAVAHERVGQAVRRAAARHTDTRSSAPST